MEMCAYVIGNQEGTISCTRYCKSKGNRAEWAQLPDCLISSNWNGSIALWDAHATSLTTPLNQTHLSNKAKAYSFDFLGEKYAF